MNNLPRWMKKLSWRLAFSYLLVTLVAAFTIQTAAALGPALQELQQNQTPPDQFLTKQSSMPFARYLERPAPDSNALRYWMAMPLFDALSRQYRQTRFVSVLDAHGQVLAATTCGSTQFLSSSPQACFTTAEEQAQSLLTLPQVQSALHTVLQQEDQSTGSVTLQNGSLVLTPVMVEKVKVAGLLAVLFDGSPTSSGSVSGPQIFLLAWWNHVQPEGLAFLLLASLLGTLMGLLISRTLTRRLRQITRVAALWSKGQFQVAIPDRSPDELGQLAHDLNQMARQVQILLRTRQQLTLLEERQRVARDLHDSVKQHTFALALLIGAGKKYLERDTAQVRLYLTEAEELAEQTRQELTTIIQELRPLALTEKGLATVLREYAHQWSRRTGIATSIFVQETPSLPPEQEEQVLRVMQEALSNVTRHSKASQVSVRLWWEPEQVCLLVHDNGRGFDMVRATGKGLGLITMRERIEACQGTLRISSTKEGTMVEARVPGIPSCQERAPEEMINE